MSHGRTVIAVVILALVTLVGLAVIGTIGGSVLDITGGGGDEGVDYPEVGETYVFDDSIDEEPPILNIQATKENAAYLDGDGHVDGVDTGNWSDGDWSVCAAAELDDDAHAGATYNVFAYDNESILVEYADGEWRALHYSGDDSAEASITADEPFEFSPFCASWDDVDETLTISDGETEDTGSLTAESPDRRVANDWHGSIDEVRLINQTVPTADVETYADDPVAPLADLEHSARYMFNEGDGETTHVHYADDEAQLVGASWGSGVAGPGLTEGEDYVVSFDPLSVEILSGGYLVDAPYLSVEWDTGFNAMVESVLSGTGSALSLVPILMLVLMASIVIAVVQRMRG